MKLFWHGAPTKLGGWPKFEGNPPRRTWESACHKPFSPGVPDRLTLPSRLDVCRTRGLFFRAPCVSSRSRPPAPDRSQAPSLRQGTHHGAVLGRRKIALRATHSPVLLIRFPPNFHQACRTLGDASYPKSSHFGGGEGTTVLGQVLHFCPGGRPGSPE